MKVSEITLAGCCMTKNCIFNDKKVCNSCGECDVCELNSEKKCNNCGKCLELEGYDVKAIKIDEVFEDELIEELEDDFYDKNDIDLSEEQKEDDKIEVEVDEIPKLEEYEAMLAEEEFSKLNKDDFIAVNDEIWEYIDDVEGVKELLENEDDNSELLHEEFPGLITLKKM